MSEITEDTKNIQLEVKDLETIFNRSRPTIYSMIDERSKLIPGVRTKRVISVADVIEIINEREAALIEQANDLVNEPRQRLLDLLGISS